MVRPMICEMFHYHTTTNTKTTQLRRPRTLSPKCERRYKMGITRETTEGCIVYSPGLSFDRLGKSSENSYSGVDYQPLCRSWAKS